PVRQETAAPRGYQADGRMVQHDRDRSNMSPARSSLLSALTIALAWTAFMGRAGGTTLAAWVELIGPDARSSVRAIIDEGNCPDLTVDGKSLRMNVRADPGPLFPRDRKEMPRADFQVRVCETIVPAGAARALLEGKPLPLPPAEIRRVIVF